MRTNEQLLKEKLVELKELDKEISTSLVDALTDSAFAHPIDTSANWIIKHHLICGGARF